MRYKRILLKLSGGALASENGFGFDQGKLDKITDTIIKAANAGVEVSVLVGGGNILRGKTAEFWNIERAEADNIGMLATIINSLILRGVLTSKGVEKVRVMTSMPIDTVAEPYIRLKAIDHLDKGQIVIFGGGIGQPFVTTDYPSVQRAIEIRADAVFMAKQGTDGVYDSNPNENPNAKKFSSITYDDVIAKNLKVADQSAFILAKDYNMPMYVFDFTEEDSISRICKGEELGTYIGPDCETKLA